jgi:hypothetical protein
VGQPILRNEDLNASQPYTHVRPMSRRRNWGFTVGGPVYIPKVYNGRDKTFFFANLDWYYNFGVTDTYSTVPTAKMRIGDFSEALTGRTLGTNPAGGSITENMIFDPLTNQTVNGQIARTPFPGNVVPQTRLDPVALKIQAMLPQPSRSEVLLFAFHPRAPFSLRVHVRSRTMGDEGRSACASCW